MPQVFVAEPVRIADNVTVLYVLCRFPEAFTLTRGRSHIKVYNLQTGLTTAVIRSGVTNKLSTIMVRIFLIIPSHAYTDLSAPKKLEWGKKKTDSLFLINIKVNQFCLKITYSYVKGIFSKLAQEFSISWLHVCHLIQTQNALQFHCLILEARNFVWKQTKAITVRLLCYASSDLLDLECLFF